MPLNSKITTTNRPVTANGKHRFHKVTQPLPPDYPRQARAATLRQLSTWKSALSTRSKIPRCRRPDILAIFAFTE